VFIDETSLNTKLAPLYGRSPVGERCLGKEPHGHWQCSTFICALRQEGLGSPMLLDGAMNGNCFLAYLQQVLIPDLRPGDTVICDNLASHKVAGVAQLIEAAGAAMRYLPPYSPDLNPIEMAFAKLKNHLRKAKARHFDKLIVATEKAINSFLPIHCANFLKHAGYA
jgi:transposase